MTASKRRCKFDLQQLTGLCTTFDKANPQTYTTSFLQVKLEELDRRWIKLVSSYEEYVLGEEKVKDEDFKNELLSAYDEASFLYQATKTRILEIIKAIEQKPDEPVVQKSSFKLPTCDIQPFEGGYAKWPAFRDMFQAIVGKETRLAPVQKLDYLKTKLRGEAFNVIKDFDSVDGNYTLAWEALGNRFENKRLLVNDQMKKVHAIQVSQTETLKSIRYIRNTVADCLSILRTFKVIIADDDPFLLHVITTKLPEETLRAWEITIENHRELPSWSNLSEFLTSRIEFLETMTEVRKPLGRENQTSRSHSFHTQAVSEKQNYSCKKCRQNHPLKACSQFKALSPNDRLKFVFTNKYCVNCLSTSHFKSKCQSNYTCSICNQRHHTMLHLEKRENTGNFKNSRSHSQPNPHDGERPSGSGAQSQIRTYNTQVSNTTTSNDGKEILAHFVQEDGTTVLPTVLAQLECAGELFTIRALIDTGSEKSFITTAMQQKFAIPLETKNANVSGLGGAVVGRSKGRCNVIIKSRISDFKLRVNAVVVPTLSSLLPSRQFKLKNLDDIKDLTLADPYFYKPAKIDMIIGSNYLPSINLEGVRLNVLDTFEARESHFGWYLLGPEPLSDIQVFTTTVSDSEEVMLNDQIKKFWELEEVEREIQVKDSDIFCENFYQSTTIRQPDGRYMVRLPFKEEFPNDIFLGPSRNMALAQYHRMEKTLEKVPDLKGKYQSVLQEYIDLGHMEPVSHNETVGEKQFSFFLPHHAVIRPESKSTKVRVVFNASKKTNSGFSLNDVLHQGPILQTDLMQIIINWRNYKYVFTGDIQKMYRQILVHEADRPYQQILFREKAESAAKSFQLKTVTFGVNCAPFLAIRTLLQLSEDCKTFYPEASEILKNEIYVDDILSGGYTLEEAKLKLYQLNQSLNSAGFPMKKITANNSYLLQHLAREDLLDEELLKLDDSSTMKTLGIRWNAMSDVFYYVVEPTQISPSATKRQILSAIAKLFDPLGWLGPIVVVAKLLMQELWERKLDWDEGVPPIILVKWHAFLKNLPQITALKIPRWIHFSPTYHIQIHGFCDASEKAYCGAIYMRTTTSDEKISSNLLVAKTKVAPIKKLTIPKLELCGALLLARLVKSLTTTAKFPYELFFWTDSSIVLGWLQKEPQALKTFVANRVTKILDISGNSQWKHVKTDNNPADLGTRGCTPQELIESELWWHGPTWLQQKMEVWPKPRTFDPSDLETKGISNFHLIQPQSNGDNQNLSAQGGGNSDDILGKFSSLERALRVISYQFRFINRILKRPFKTDSFITTEEIQFVKNRLIMLAQKNYFYKEYESCHKKRPLNRKSRLLTLNPFLDKDGLLRVGGRLENSGFSYNERHPIIIPERSRFATLFIEYTHKILLHSEHNIMLRAIRQGFYIIRLKNLVRKCIRNCRACTIYKHKFQHQIMAALPPERVNFSLPFTYTGVDFAGPFTIKSSTLRNAKLLKGYAAVFVCFSTRAVHLEVCSDLSTDAFLACFSRFTGRRGLPKTMFSDNGRNFLGASVALLKTHNEFLKTSEKALVEKYGSHGFSWSFIPPYAPHMGGLWEAAVKSMKSHLKKVATNLTFTYEEFATLLIRIEAVLNSRPISSLTENPSELLPLTPGHLLRGAPMIAPPEAAGDQPQKELSFIKRWDRLKALQQIFARRWKNEYVTELQRRFKWKTEQQNVKVNDFVIIKDDLLPPTEWRLGRVTNVICGSDGRVRVAEVKTANGTMRRPIVKLCVLPLLNTPPDLVPNLTK